MEAKLDREMSAVITQLRLFSAVPAHGYNGKGGGRPDSAPPPGAGWAGSGHCEAEHLVARYSAAISNSGREQVLKEARDELKGWRGEKDKERPTGISFEQMILEDGEGYAADHVARRYGISTGQVSRIRHRAGRSMIDGVSLSPKADGERIKLNPQARREEVKRMKDKGMTNRQIATMLKYDEITIRRDLRAT